MCSSALYTPCARVHRRASHQPHRGTPAVPLRLHHNEHLEACDLNELVATQSMRQVRSPPWNQLIGRRADLTYRSCRCRNILVI
jgi:hypothetical protein